MLDEILYDFRFKVDARLRKARREERSLTDAELDDLLNDLREDLRVAARRTRHLEDHRHDGGSK